MIRLPDKVREALAVRDEEDSEKVLKIWQRSRILTMRFQSKPQDGQGLNELTMALRDRRARL